MEITKKEIETLLGQKVKDYKVESVYDKNGVLHLNIVVQPKKAVEKVKITIKPKRAQLFNIRYLSMMIRTVKHKNKDYIIIDTTFQVREEGKTISAPLHLRVDGTDLSKEDYYKLFKRVSISFDRTVTVDITKPTLDSKPWWKRIFN